MNDVDGMVKEFLLESFDNLNQVDCDLVALERDPNDQERLAAVFRAVHTIKGTCGFFNYSKLGNLSHAGESLLSRLRDGQLSLTPQIIAALLEFVDALREILSRIASLGDEGDGDHGDLIATLTRLQLGQPVADARAKAIPKAVPGLPPVRERREEISERSIRADVALLDRLMHLTGELVLVRNQIVQLCSRDREPAMQNAAQRLNLITSELQEGVMKTRLQPVGLSWDKFPRIVRDLATACGKQARVELEGKDTELDKTIVEAIKDPLVHLVRNAVGHGIESPAERVARGKPPEGRVRLQAFHESGLVNIVLSDDGAGIDPLRIKRRAIERGLITPTQADELSDRETLNLIFLPGFSTADEVTDVSGRGVGMDVVKTNIKKIGGTLDVRSQLGGGTTFTIKLPLTLAIIPALAISCGGEQYMIPHVSLLRLIRLEGARREQEIETIDGQRVHRLSGKLLPLVDLGRVLGHEPTGSQQTDATDAPLSIVVLQADDQRFGLVVDEINDTEDIVVQPLSQSLKTNPVLAGVTILGDGRVALILDVLAIAQRSGVASMTREMTLTAKAPDAQQAAAKGEEYLLAELASGNRVATPMRFISRLEEIPADCVEQVGSQLVAQRRGEILPLFNLNELLGDEGPAIGASDRQVIICDDGSRKIGLVVRRVLDVVSATPNTSRCGQAPGVAGSAIIQQRVTLLIDPPSVIAMLGDRDQHAAVLEESRS